MTQSLKWSKIKNSLLPVLTRRSTIQGFCQILIAFVFTSTIFIGIPYWEPQTKNEKGELVCQQGKVEIENFICRLGNSKLLQQIQNFSVVFIAFLFILDTFERKKRAYREAWSLIDGSRESETSGARILALKELYEDKVSLKGLDAENADLMEINLQGAVLEKANLQGSLLQRSNLIKANLQESNLRQANLKEAKLQNANLRRAKLEEANLDKAELQGAILKGANMQRVLLENAQLQEADLSGADFRGADLWRANLSGANIENAIFVGAKNLNINQIQKAKNWQKAKYSKDFAPELGELFLREEVDDKLNIIESNKTILTDNLLLSLTKLFMMSEPNKHQQIIELQQKINTALELINNSPTLSTKDSIELESIISEVVTQWLKAKVSPKKEVEEELRKELQNLHDNREEGQKKVQRRKEFDILASEWLKPKYINLTDLGIRSFLNKYPEMHQLGGLLETQDKISQLAEDIGNCLNVVVESLSTHTQPVVADVIVLKMPQFIYLDVLNEIREEVIPKLVSSESGNLSYEALQRLQGYLFLLGIEIEKIKK
ncbi:pentapeptide repeat-containing protein [Tolypothrix sp. PCC 7910]|uniref:pentapeptide repeat-containing protein n=1 Tax=Tolypothrix sp. PCC 7910 TaxID=2099387 RepID=UPI0014279539|nr:pentapeptide repeat-containing protein [Tolypothrix sp. PCC 7910]QIR40235.1 pentapeptide repeat-containing protein [Tolypothrix sp. PCC 7910]